MKILIVDDSPEDREWLRRLVAQSSDGANIVQEAETGEQGLETFKSDPADCILLDFGLPDLDGLEFIEICKKEMKYPPIVMLTGQGNESIAVEAMKRGAQDYLVKGRVSQTELRRAVINAIEKAKLLQKNDEYQTEIQNKLQAARAIQQGLLPESPILYSGYEIGGVSHPAHAAGGDYFDVISLRDNGLGVVVGDVAGHGFDAAILAAALHSYIRAIAHKETQVSQILADTNSLFLDRNPEGMFATVMLVRLDPKTRSLTYSSAGHPPAFVIADTGEVRASLASTAPPLGLFPDLNFPASAPIELNLGETVLLATDGVREASAHGRYFGDEGALELVQSNLARPAQEIAECICAAAREFHLDDGNDDITAVIIKTTA